MDASQNAPSLSQAIRIKKLAQQGEFDYDAIYDIMNEEKKSELDTVTIKNETLRKYFPRNYTPRQMEYIIKLLDQWQLKKQHHKNRYERYRLFKRCCRIFLFRRSACHVIPFRLITSLPMVEMYIPAIGYHLIGREVDY